LNTTQLWFSNDEKDWESALTKYWDYILPGNFGVEKRMENLDANAVKAMDVEEFYDFLFKEYYFWKYTAKNRLASTRAQLQRYKTENKMQELADIKRDIFSFDVNRLYDGLEIASRIKGLGISGASGLLALLYPEKFATVDQFVVKALNSIDGIEKKEELSKINPDNITIKNGVLLICYMQYKAYLLNEANKTTIWTPRKIDKALWTVGH
jgi:hypothetical protein